MDQVDLRFGFEQLAGEVRDAAAASRAVIHFAGIFLRVIDQLGDARDRQGRMHGENFRHAHHQRDERRVLLHVVRQLGERERRNRERRAAVEAERVAVGRRLQRAVDAEHAADAADVLDDHRLAELLAQPVRQPAPENIRRAAGREGHDHLHRLGRISLRPREHRHEQQQPEQSHRFSVLVTAYRHATVDHDLRAGDEPRLIGRQKQHRVRRVAAVAGKAQWNALHPAFQ